MNYDENSLADCNVIFAQIQNYNSHKLTLIHWLKAVSIEKKEYFTLMPVRVLDL